MNGVSDDIIKELQECRDNEEHPDKVYLNLENYHSVLKETDFASYPTTDTSVGRIVGLEVIIVQNLEQEMMVLDTAPYPKAEDFKSGDYRPLPISSRLSYSDV